jgi:hypothetical protein
VIFIYFELITTEFHPWTIACKLIFAPKLWKWPNCSLNYVVRHIFVILPMWQYTWHTHSTWRTLGRMRTFCTCETPKFPRKVALVNEL